MDTILTFPQDQSWEELEQAIAAKFGKVESIDELKEDHRQRKLGLHGRLFEIRQQVLQETLQEIGQQHDESVTLELTSTEFANKLDQVISRTLSAITLGTFQAQYLIQEYYAEVVSDPETLEIDVKELTRPVSSNVIADYWKLINN